MPVLQATDERISYKRFQEIAPQVVSALRAVSGAFPDSTLEKELIELVKIRASQINGCAFCAQFHLNDARKLGVPAAKLDLVVAWRDAGIYSEREAAALEWTEMLTLAAQRHVTDELYARTASCFAEQELVHLTTVIAQINFWNRIAAPLRFAPPIPSQELGR